MVISDLDVVELSDTWIMDSRSEHFIPPKFSNFTPQVTSASLGSVADRGIHKIGNGRLKRRYLPDFPESLEIRCVITTPKS